MRQEHQLNICHMRCLRKILGVTSKDRISNHEILAQTSIPSIYSLLSQHRLRWAGHVRRMQDGCIPKDIMYGELEQGTRAAGRPKLNYRDVLKRDLRSTDINIQTWEQSATDRPAWRQIVHAGISAPEAKRAEASLEKRQRR